MKRFIRTLAGKTVLFILCAASVCVLGASICGVVLYTRDDLEFYRTSEQDMMQEILVDNTLRSAGYSLLWDILGDTREDRYDFEYRITDGNGKTVEESAGFSDTDSEPYAFSYRVVTDHNGDFAGVYYNPSQGTDDPDAEPYTVMLSLREGTSTQTELSLLASLVHTAYALRYAVYFIGAAAFLIAVTCFIILMYVSGRRPDTGEFCPGPLHRVPYDLLFVLCAVFGIFLLWAVDAGLTGIPAVVCGIIVCVIGVNVGLGLCMSAASRIKQHALLKNTLIFRILKLVRNILCRVLAWLKKLHAFNVSLFRGIPLVWKTGIAACGIAFLELIVIVAGDGRQGPLLAAWLIEKIILIPALLYLALSLRKLQAGGSALAGGDLSYHTDTRGMFWDLKQHGENLNSIAGGMAIAVEDRLKSERMKTELITNVSHDIKTPLTSIINYASLIGSETCDNPSVQKYSEVLVRQSEKLKRLIEDLVEASKASTGNLDVLLAPCDAAVFLTQAGGEYEEKLQKAELSLITKLPEKELRIMADGRRMWRIFDNLMNNICKYAQPGTRVYLSLEERDGNAVVTFKNTSREPLDMSEEELMERFTRGDASRNTEGNGLGLSIAKSMAELQGGSLRLSIDGDLFKAVLSFPLIP